MNHWFKQFALAITLAVIALPGVAEPFRLVVTHLEPPLVPNSVMDMALELGYFERERVEVELVRVQQTPSAIAALQAGEGDMANISTDALLKLAAGGVGDLVAVASPNKALPFLIAAREGISTPEDLAGHTFGVGRMGSLDHSLSADVLGAQGVDMSALDLVALGQPGIRAQALLAGYIDATTMSIGVWLSLPDHDGVRVIVDADAYHAAAPLVTKVNVVTRDALRKRRHDIERVLTALVRASRDFAEDPELWASAMDAALPHVDAGTLDELARSYANSWSVNGGLQKDELLYTADWLYQGPDYEGLPRVELEDWTDFGPLDTVLEALGPDESMDRVSR